MTLRLWGGLEKNRPNPIYSILYFLRVHQNSTNTHHLTRIAYRKDVTPRENFFKAWKKIDRPFDWFIHNRWAYQTAAKKVLCFLPFARLHLTIIIIYILLQPSIHVYFINFTNSIAQNKWPNYVLRCKTFQKKNK